MLLVLSMACTMTTVYRVVLQCFGCRVCLRWLTRGGDAEHARHGMHWIRHHLERPAPSAHSFVQVPRLKADASARVARSLADAYEAVYQAIGDSSNGYVPAGQPCPLKHTPEQVRTILGVVTDF